MTFGAMRRATGAMANCEKLEDGNCDESGPAANLAAEETILGGYIIWGGRKVSR